MDNQLQPITSMETLEVNARERFSERLTVTSVGTLALNLFALFLCLAIFAEISTVGNSRLGLSCLCLSYDGLCCNDRLERL